MALTQRGQVSQASKRWVHRIPDTNYLVELYRGNRYVYIWDITDPDNPTQTQAWDGGATTWTMNNNQDYLKFCGIFGNILFQVSGYDTIGRLAAFDLSSAPSSVTQLDYQALEGSSSPGATFQGISDGDYCYITRDSGAHVWSHLYVYDVRDPSNLVGYTGKTPEGQFSFGGPQSPFLHPEFPNSVYVIAASRICEVDVSTKASPTLSTTKQLSDWFTVPSWTNWYNPTIKKIGGKYYLFYPYWHYSGCTGEVDCYAGWYIWDVDGENDPANWDYLGKYESLYGGGWSHFVGNYVYVAGGSNNITHDGPAVFDLSSPSSPVWLDSDTSPTETPNDWLSNFEFHETPQGVFGILNSPNYFTVYDVPVKAYKFCGTCTHDCAIRVIDPDTWKVWRLQEGVSAGDYEFVGLPDDREMHIIAERNSDKALIAYGVQTPEQYSSI